MVFLSRNDELIVDGMEVAIKGRKFILDISDETDIKAHLLSELTTLGETFDFICKYYPDYGRADEVAWLDDLDCIIDEECDEEKTERITSEWGSDPDIWQTERDRIYQELLQGAIENYKKTNNIE